MGRAKMQTVKILTVKFFSGLSWDFENQTIVSLTEEGLKAGVKKALEYASEDQDNGFKVFKTPNETYVDYVIRNGELKNFELEDEVNAFVIANPED